MTLAFSSKGSNPVVRTFLQEHINSPDTLNLNIHKDDEMYLHGLMCLQGARNSAICAYFSSGQESMNTVRQIVNWKFKGFKNVSAFLDFASGYGRVTRFLIQELPPQRVWVSDIYANGVKFQQEQFGVNGIVSVTNPEDYVCDKKFDCIFVASLFSHLPESTFIAWLRKLYSLLSPSGVLMFSVHGETLIHHIRETWKPDLVMPESGICFLEVSESRTLNKQQYGSTYVTESFVRRAIHRATDGKGKYRRLQRGLWRLQDVYVVVNDPNQDFSNLKFDYGPEGYLDDCELTQPNELRLGGWAAYAAPGGWVKDVQILINGQLRQRCMPYIHRIGVAKFHGDEEDERFLYSGYRCYCHLPKGTSPSTDILTVKAISNTNLEYVFHHSTIEDALLQFRKADQPPVPNRTTEATSPQQSEAGEPAAPEPKSRPRKSFRMLLGEAAFHYRRGGAKVLAIETLKFLQRRLER